MHQPGLYRGEKRAGKVDGKDILQLPLRLGMARRIGIGWLPRPSSLWSAGGFRPTSHRLQLPRCFGRSCLADITSLTSSRSNPTYPAHISAPYWKPSGFWVAMPGSLDGGSCKKRLWRHRSRWSSEPSLSTWMFSPAPWRLLPHTPKIDAACRPCLDITTSDTQLGASSRISYPYKAFDISGKVVNEYSS